MYEQPSRIEVYRLANRAERVSREAAAFAATDVVEMFGWALIVAGAALVAGAWTRELDGVPR